MRKHLQIGGLLSALLLASGVEAAGLGKLSIQSALGQPLRAEIELLAVQREELGTISARLASAEAFRQARMERAEALNSLRFEVDQRPNGQPVIKITSTAPVNDPFLDMLIELNWSTGRLIREYTLLLDPPADARPKAETPPPQAVVSTRAEREPATRPAAADEPSAARPAERMRYGPVKAGESLHAIASKTKPADVTLEQMMVGIYQQNTAAFQGNNMNRLKRGAILVLPDRDTAMRVDPARASREVRMHADAWNAYRSRLADAAAVRAAGAAPEAAAGRVVPTPERREAPPAAAAEDVLRLSKGEPGAAKAMEKIQSLEEELAAKGRALLEAQERVAQLERTVKDMQRLLELKQAEPPVAAPPVQPAAPVAPPPAAEATTSTDAAPTPKAAQPKAVAAPLPVPAEESPSWLSTFISNPLYVGGIVAAVLLSFLLWMMMVGTRRRKGLTNFEDSIMTGGEFKNEAVFTAGTGVAGTPTGGSALMTDFSRLGLGAIDAHEVDPIAEAEVYMAYGRDTQAEEILKEALAKDPNRHEISLKLLEIYAARKDTVAFETQASELYASLGGQPTEVWMKAAEMGRSIDPDNPLYRLTPGLTSPAAMATGAAAAAAAAAMAAPTAPAAHAPAANAPGEALTDLGLLSDASETQLQLSSDVEALMESEATPTMAEAPAPVEALDLGLTEPSAGPELQPEDLSTLEMALPGQQEPERLAVVEGPEAVGYDLSLDVTEIEEPLPPPVTPEVTVAEAATGVAGVEQPGEALASEPAPAAEAPYAAPELDLSGIDLELGEPPAQVEPTSLAGLPETPAFEAVAPAVEEVTAEAAMEIDPEVWEETNTKLDLARAYMEMGDHEGAREILQEVLSDGDSRQRSEAQKLLAEVV